MPKSSDAALAEGLCLVCGLCCNGVIFAKVKLQPGDLSAPLRAVGLKLQPSPRQDTLHFRQPCSAHDGCRCRVYENRPTYCRQFDCLLLKRVRTGELPQSAAVTVIQSTRRRVERIRDLLGKLGDTEDHLPLRARFSRTTRRLERASLDRKNRQTYSQLTLAMHQLNLLLSDTFYPSSQG